MSSRILKDLEALYKMADEDNRIKVFLSRLEKQVETFVDIFDIDIGNSDLLIEFPIMSEDDQTLMNTLHGRSLDELVRFNLAREYAVIRKRPSVST